MLPALVGGYTFQITLIASLAVLKEVAFVKTMLG